MPDIVKPPGGALAESPALVPLVAVDLTVSQPAAPPKEATTRALPPSPGPILSVLGVRRATRSQTRALKIVRAVFTGFCSSVIAGIIAGIVVVKYQITAALPTVRSHVAPRDPHTWEVLIINRSSIPASGTTVQLEFDAPVAAHSQPHGLISWGGRPLDSSTALAGRSQ